MLLFINEIFAISWKDIIDIILVAYLIYAFYNLIRGTAALNIFLGIIALYLLWKLVDASGLNLLTEILGQFIGVGVIALLIVFQQEIRKFLLLLGSQRLIDNKHRKFLFWKIHIKDNEETNIAAIIQACTEMSKNKTGALIVITDKNELLDIQTSGIKIKANISKELLESIFYKNSPLHDGAIIISGNKILAAKCILPISNNDNLPDNAGLRHRSALGISENSDALTIVVSEQNGNLSTTKDGILNRALSPKELENQITQFLE